MQSSWISSKVSPRQLGQYVRETAQALQQTGEYDDLLTEAEKAGDTLSLEERLIIEYALISIDMENIPDPVEIKPIVIDDLRKHKEDGE